MSEKSLELPPKRGIEIRKTLLRYAVGVALVGAGAALRWMLTPVVGENAPFVTFFSAVIFTAWLVGTGPAILAAVLGFVTSIFIAQHSGVGGYPVQGKLLAFILYTFVCTSVIWTQQSLRRARDTAHELAERALKIEARYRRLTDSPNFGVVIGNLEGKILEANDAYLGIIGRSRAELYAGTINWKQLTAPEYASADVEVLRQLRATGEAPVHEKAYLRPDGSRVPVLIGISMLDEGYEHGLAYVVDCSERKRIEQERDALLMSERAAREHAERMGRVKDEFLATLSHELRTPMNAVLGWLHLLRNGAVPEAEIPRALEAIERNARSQVQLIDDLLDVSRIISGNLRVDVRELDLGSVIDGAIETVQPALNAKGIQLHREADGVGGIVKGDSGRLRQVVWNLLSNAIKFTPANGSISVLLKHERDQAMIVVSDTGQGIAPAMLERVFDRFWQADSSFTRTFNGLGLGLAIARQLVELHGGQIRAESPGEGKGSTFTVTLPLAIASERDPISDPEFQQNVPAGTTS